MITLGLYWMFSFIYLAVLTVKWYNEEEEDMQKNFRYYYILITLIVLVSVVCMFILPFHLAETEYEKDRNARDAKRKKANLFNED